VKTRDTLCHFMIVLVGTVVVALPAVGADPAARRFLTNHPGLAAYYAVAVAAAGALSRLWFQRSR
jgi:hypothetical protein